MLTAKKVFTFSVSPVITFSMSFCSLIWTCNIPRASQVAQW